MKLAWDEHAVLAQLAVYGPAIKRSHWNAFETNGRLIGPMDVVERLSRKGLCRVERTGETTMLELLQPGHDLLRDAADEFPFLQWA